MREIGMELTRRQAARLLAEAMVGAPVVAAGIRASTTEIALAAANKPTLPGAQPAAPVYIVLWFDTEDYILPESDDAALRIADFLTQQGVRATFKVVGEKARVLERRQRTDVIAALARHEIGYHSNTHSQQPTPAVYESVLDWETGQEEFNRRERPGFDDVTRIFGRPPSCYGQPGVSWAPQAYPALKKWGVNVYLDDGDHVQLNGKPFWYGGLLNIFHIDAGRQLEQNNDWSNLESAKANFKTLYTQMSADPPGGVVSFMFHPTQLISEVFWDAVNFAHGANPAPSEWKMQPKCSPEQRERAFQYLEGVILYAKSFPGVRFVTASEAYVVCRDKAQGRAFSTAELAQVASQVKPGITFQVSGDYSLSAGDIFYLLNSLVCRYVSNGAIGKVTLADTPYGPASQAYGLTMPVGATKIGWSQFSRTSIDVNEFITRRRSIPNAVWFGSTAVTPEAYLLALANVAQDLVSDARPPDSVKILPAELSAAQWVAKDSPSIWEWPIFPPGFHSGHLIELARLQAWTIKPAILEGTRRDAVQKPG
jgi:hypothetical protein